MAENTVSINIRGNKKLNDVPVEKFLELCDRMNKTHCLALKTEF